MIKQITKEFFLSSSDAKKI